MDEIFSVAKNQSPICTKNGIFLHSNYNPEREAERFVQSLEAPFLPRYVVITEPALSYCVPFLRERFANTKICCIRYSKVFAKSDNAWDKVFYANSLQNGKKLSIELLNFLGEEESSTTLFFSWKASEKAYSDIFVDVWNEIKAFLEMSKSVLATRIFFNKRWLKNSLNFCINLNKSVNVQKTNKPIIFVASGPSLKNMFCTIKKYRKHFILLAASSSLSALLQNDIVPDFCISTDGGFWAKEHFKHLARKNFTHANLTFCISSEAMFSKDLFLHYNVLPLLYGDGVDGYLFDACQITSTKAMRNGTVSGTAVELALNLTSSKVFCIGLDLEATKCKSHTEPNELALNNAINDKRLLPKETRMSQSAFASEQLEIYRNWFESNSERFNKRLVRVYAKNAPYNRCLCGITDIADDDFIKEITLQNDDLKISTLCAQNTALLPKAQRKQKLSFYLASIKERIKNYYTEKCALEKIDKEITEWLKMLCLSEYLVAKKSGLITEELFIKATNALKDMQRLVCNAKI